MASSTAKNAEEYLAELPADRRKELSEVLKVVRKRMPKGYAETMGYGMITWNIPLKDYPETYNGQPLMYTALAAQKNYCALYLLAVYSDPVRGPRLKAGFAKAGKKPDMGKSCIRFQKSSDLPLDTIGDLVAEIPPAEFIVRHEENRAAAGAGRKAKSAAKTKAAPVKKAAKSVKRVSKKK